MNLPRRLPPHPHSQPRLAAEGAETEEPQLVTGKVSSREAEKGAIKGRSPSHRRDSETRSDMGRWMGRILSNVQGRFPLSTSSCLLTPDPWLYLPATLQPQIISSLPQGPIWKSKQSSVPVTKDLGTELDDPEAISQSLVRLGLQVGHGPWGRGGGPPSFHQTTVHVLHTEQGPFLSAPCP